MPKPAKETVLERKFGTAKKRANSIRIVFKPKSTGWKGIHLNFEKEIFTSRALNKSELKFFLDDEESGFVP